MEQRSLHLVIDFVEQLHLINRRRLCYALKWEVHHVPELSIYNRLPAFELQVWDLPGVPAYLQVHDLMGPLQQMLEVPLELVAALIALEDVLIEESYCPIRLRVHEVKLRRQYGTCFLMYIS